MKGRQGGTPVSPVVRKRAASPKAYTARPQEARRRSLTALLLLSYTGPNYSETRAGRFVSSKSHGRFAFSIRSKNAFAPCSFLNASSAPVIGMCHRKETSSPPTVAKEPWCGVQIGSRKKACFHTESLFAGRSQATVSRASSKNPSNKGSQAISRSRCAHQPGHSGI